MPSSLTVRVVDDAEFMPVEYQSQDRSRGGIPVHRREIRVGVYSSNGSAIKEALLLRENTKGAPAPRRPIDAQAGDAAYGGLITGHYGHFLVETLSRYWYLREHLDERIVWHGTRRRLLGWQQEIFALLGLAVTRDDIVMDPTRFRRLAVPAPGAVIRRYIRKRQAKALGVFPFREPTGRRVWLSRSLLAPDRGGVEGETDIERLLDEDGWDVFHPQTVPVADQLERLADASVIAGFDGSAFHTLLLARDIRARIVIVRRADTRSLGTYDHIASAKRFEQAIVGARTTHVQGAGRKARHRIADPAKVFETVRAAAASLQPAG